MIPIGRRDWRAVEPVSVNRSWPLHELTCHFDLGCILNSAAIDAVIPPDVGALCTHHSGSWECNLADDSLAWSGGVFDMFGLPRGITVVREDCLRLYSEHSRTVMERLRAHSIRNSCGFTLDAEVHSAVGETRWIRIIAAPICEDGKAVRLQGLKLVLS